MAIKKSQIEKWIVAQKKHRLSDTHVQMARELGLNPDKLGKIDKPLKQILKEQEIKDKEKKKEKEKRRKEHEQEQMNNGTDEVLPF